MKKYLLLIVVLLLPISVMARQESKERLFSVIDDISNVFVDENKEILDTIVDRNTILFEMDEEGDKSTREVSFTFQDTCFSFYSGSFLIEKSKDTYQVGKVENNQYAFYLYSILENLSTAPYDEDTYFNSLLIDKIISGLSLDEKKNLFEGVFEKQYYDSGKTFGLRLVGEKISPQQVKVRVEYQYYLDGDDTILVNPIVEEGKNQLFKNPETGNYSFFVTTLLIIVIGLAAYTYCNPKDNKEG